MGIRMNEALCETFSTRLFTVRKVRRLTQEQLGEKSGLHPSHISFMETGRRHPMLETVYRLATALECSTDYLLGLTENMDGGGVPQEVYDELLTENETLRKLIKEAM